MVGRFTDVPDLPDITFPDINHGDDQHGSDINENHQTPKPGFRWLRGAGSTVFPGTVKAGTVGGEPAYVCRAYQDMKLSPGRFVPSAKKCEVPYEFPSHTSITNLKSTFDLLTGGTEGKDYEWKKVKTGESYVDGTLEAGKVDGHGNDAYIPMYPCRVTKDQDTDHPQTYVGASFVGTKKYKTCDYSLGENYEFSYEVLVGTEADEYEYDSNPNLGWTAMKWYIPNPKLAPYSVKVGEHDGEPTYVCRTWNDGDETIGWYAPSRGYCDVANPRAARKNNYFDLLTGTNYKWLHIKPERFNGGIFDGVSYKEVTVGRNHDKWVCRARHADEPEDAPYHHGVTRGNTCHYVKPTYPVDQNIMASSFDILAEYPGVFSDH